MNSDFEKLFNLEEEKELPLEVLEDEENSQYFEGTEKYNNKVINSEYIIPFLNKSKSKIGRIFMDKDKKEKYLEIFRNEIMDVLGISQNITFLHSYLHDKKQHYDQKKFIGFRYYENNPYENGNYFTLIKKNYSNYYILEKNNSLKDIKGNTFYDKEINCYTIMRKIMFEKYNKKLIGDNGDVFPEIIGYCFALASLNKIESFHFVKPLIANLGAKNSLLESMPKEIENDSIYIEPFIYDGHISTIISSFKEKERYNIFLDMSHHHFKNESPMLIFLPKSLKNAHNIFFPNKEIQAYSSSCLWFFGEIECLLKNKKYSSFKGIYMSLRENSIEFYVDIINLLSKEIDGNDYLIKIVKKEDKDMHIAEKIDFNRFPLYYDEKYYEINKNIIYNKFLDIKKFIENKFLCPDNTEIFYRTQSYIRSIYELKNNLLLNYKYYDILLNNEEIEEGKKCILQIIKNINESIDFFKKKYDYAFYHYNMLFYCLWIRQILDQISIPIIFNQEEKEKICHFNFQHFMEYIFGGYYEITKMVEKKIRLFSEETILNELNCQNEICFNLMNK